MSPRNVAPRLITSLLVAILALSALGTQAVAVNGDLLRQIIADRTGTNCASINARGDHSSVGVGIAFDGTNLLISCYSDNTITLVNPANGAQVSHYTVTGASALGALAYDAGRAVIWGCSRFSEVGTIDPGTHAFTSKFSVPGCFDGLAYDATDDTIWTSPDATGSVTHAKANGTLLSTTSIPIPNSGIAVGGSTLYLANDGGQQIYTSPKDFSTPLVLFASFPRRIEDMECDDLTFASVGKGAIWSIDAYDNILNAWEIPAGSCSFGGGGGGVKHSLALDGSTGYAEASAAKLNLTGDWTVESWFKDEDSNGFDHDNRQLINKGDRNSSPESPYFVLIGHNHLLAGVRTGWQDYPIDFDLAFAGLNPTAWHHVAVTFRADLNVLNLWLDGVQRGYQIVPAHSTAGNTLPLEIGRNGPTSDKYWLGKIDDLRIWNIARSAADITANYQSEFTGAAPAGLIANWKFNEASGTSAADSTASPANANLNGGASFSTDVHP